jgi:hypothetical protein
LNPPANQVVGIIPITGDLNASNGNMSVDPFIFLGNQWLTQSVELLGTGIFTRPDGFGGTISTTVSPGQLGAIEWFLDSQSAGNGSPITNFLSLGTHTIEAQAATTTGESASDSLTLTVRDTRPPILKVGFTDRAGNPITTSDGKIVKTSILASDICDPNPVTEGTASPVFTVSNGDAIKIQRGKLNTVKLPTMAIELFATATDASGKSGSGIAVLSIFE